MAASRSKTAKTTRTGVAGRAGDKPDKGPSGEVEATTTSPSAETVRKLHELYSKATGVRHEDAATMMVDQVVNTVFRPTGQDRKEGLDATFSTIAQMVAYDPKDVAEGMLVSQMIGAHNAAMRCLASAQIPNQSFEVREQMFKHAAKLMGIFTRQVEALDKHRNRGQQKITVEHVTVNAGGKAIIGDVGVGANAPARAEPSEPLALAHSPGALAPVIDQIDARAVELVKVRKPARDE